MYQKQEKLESSEENFARLTKLFEEKILHYSLDSVPTKLDLSKIYIINWAGAWNKVNNIGEPCRILEKNDKLAVVSFIRLGNKDTMEKDFISHIYRIEDIGEKDETFKRIYCPPLLKICKNINKILKKTKN